MDKKELDQNIENKSISNKKINSSKKKYIILGVLAVFGLTLLLSGSYAVLTKK